MADGSRGRDRGRPARSNGSTRSEAARTAQVAVVLAEVSRLASPGGSDADYDRGLVALAAALTHLDPHDVATRALPASTWEDDEEPL